MKTIEATTKTEWQVSEWGEETSDRVTVVSDENRWIRIAHESKIPAYFPPEVQSAVRAEILKHRPAGEDEWRHPDGDLYEFRLLDGELSARRAHPFAGHWYPEDRWVHSVRAAARSWRDRQWQDVPGAEGWQVRKRCDDICEVKRPNRSDMVVDREMVIDGTSSLFFTRSPEPVISACCKLLGVERARGETGCATCKWNPSQIHSCPCYTLSKLQPDEAMVDGKFYRFRVHRGQLEWQHFTPGACDPWVPVDSTDVKPPDVAAREWLSRHAPEPELAPDQVRFDDGTVGRMSMNGETVAISLPRETDYVRARAQAMWEEKQGRKVEFSGIVKCANLSDEHGSGAVLVDCDDTSVKSARPLMYKQVRVTIEPVGGE